MASSGTRWTTASTAKPRPMTEAGSITCRSSEPSASRRAATSASTVGGMASSPDEVGRDPAVALEPNGAGLDRASRRSARRTAGCPRRRSGSGRGRTPSRPAEQLVDDRVGLVGGERLEHDVLAVVALGPLGSRLEQLVAGRGEQQDRGPVRRCRAGGRAARGTSAPRRGCRRRSRPAGGGSRSPRAACGSPRTAPAPGNWAVDRPIAAATRSTTAVGSSVRPATPRAISAIFAERHVERVLVVDARRAADDLGDRPERDAVAVRQAATAEDLAALPGRGPDRELADQPGLADAGVADDRRGARTSGWRRLPASVISSRSISAFAADERGRDRGALGVRAARPRPAGTRRPARPCP